MKEKQQLHQLLIEILAAARVKDKDRVLELDPKFEALLSQTFPDATAERNQYDDCRQSCVTSLTLFTEMYDTCMKNAEERYQKLTNS